MALNAFHVMAKPSGPICNLDCKYCFYLEKEDLYPGTVSWAMPDDVLEAYVRQYIQQQEADDINFAWQGGEPTLLRIDFFRRVVELQKKYVAGKRISNAFQTNGVLLNDDWAQFFRDNDFLVGVSIDGPRELHDAYRLDRGGHPTFDRVLRGIEVLKKRGVSFNTLTTVHSRNSQYGPEVYRFLKSIGSEFLQFIPIVERTGSRTAQRRLILAGPNAEKARVTEWSVEPRQYGHFLCAIFDEWVRNDVGRIYVQLFDVSLEMWLGREASLCVFRPTCGSAMAIEHNGDLYSCDHFVYSGNRLGNIMSQSLGGMAASEQQRKFGQDKADTLPKYCVECDVRFVCNGECPKHRFERTPDGEPGLNYLCAGYKAFFRHVDPYMRFMTQEFLAQRPPANVMAFVQAQDRQVALRHAGRNAPCPCGSGKKYKRCCGADAGQGV